MIWFWVAFNVFVLCMLAIDLGIFHRKAHAVSIREAIIWTVVWITLALAFNGILWAWLGWTPALQFFTGYLIEKSLSVDNIFVFILIFSYFNVPSKYQHRVLFWGILGALVMRALFIFTGIALLEKFHWMIYVFGAFLVITGIKMAFHEDKEVHPEKNPLLLLCRRFLRVTPEYKEGRFFIRRDSKLWVTPLFLVLVFVESTDVIFALDSIPAILAITHDPFIVYTSNVFAILGLRALYFALAGIMQLFHYIHYALSAILSFVGVKMLIVDLYHIPIFVSLGVIAFCLIVSIIASLIWPKPEKVIPLEQEIKEAAHNPVEDSV